MTTRVNVQNLSYPCEQNKHVVGIKQNGTVSVVLKPGEEREFYIHDHCQLEIVEMPKQD